MTRKRERVFGGQITAPVTLFGDVAVASVSEKLAITQIKLPTQQPRRYFDPPKDGAACALC